MHILFLTQVLPYPLDAGPKVRAYYVLRHLAQAHDVTLVSFVRPSDDQAAIDHLAQFCRAIYSVPMERSSWRDIQHLTGSLLTDQSFIIKRDWAPKMADLLTSVVAEASPPFDAVHADQLWMAPYALYAKRNHPGPADLVTVLDQHNAVYLIPQRLAASEPNRAKRVLLRRETRKLAQFEAQDLSPGRSRGLGERRGPGGRRTGGRCSRGSRNQGRAGHSHLCRL